MRTHAQVSIRQATKGSPPREPFSFSRPAQAGEPMPFDPEDTFIPADPAQWPRLGGVPRIVVHPKPPPGSPVPDVPGAGFDDAPDDWFVPPSSATPGSLSRTTFRESLRSPASPRVDASMAAAQSPSRCDTTCSRNTCRPDDCSLGLFFHRAEMQSWSPSWSSSDIRDFTCPVHCAVEDCCPGPPPSVVRNSRLSTGRSGSAPCGVVPSGAGCTGQRSGLSPRSRS